MECLIQGKVIQIGSDVEFINNQPYFKIICSLDKTFLELKNGFQGHLKKGMTLTVRIQVAERTLFELLYDKIDDWLNPSKI